MAHNHHMKQLTHALAGVTFLAVGATVLITGCGESTSDTRDGDSGRRSDATEPGTRLDMGEAATIEYATGTGVGRATVKLAAVNPGRVDDLSQLRPPPEPGQTPYYLQFEITDLGPVDAEPLEALTGMKPVDSEGEIPRRILIVGAFPRCESIAGTPFPEGTTQNTCEVYTLGDDRSLDFVRYKPPTGPYRDDPIIWQLPR